MIVSEGWGNAFKAKVDTVAVTVNTDGYMGRGIALYAKKKHPDMFTRYNFLCKRGLLKIDTLWLYKDSYPKVLCFPTKKKTWDASDYKWIETNLKKLRDNYKQQGIYEIAIPPLGCANGMLDWLSVRPMIHEILGNDCDLKVHICYGTLTL